MFENDTDLRSNAVLVVGGGIAGIKASLDLAEAGRKVYVIDKAPNLGGFLPLLDRQFPTNDCQICYLSPELAKTGYGLNIEVLPLTSIIGLEGEAGAFTAKLRTEPRYIDTDLCNACDACTEAAPEGAVNFTPGLDHRAPTCMRYPQTVPNAYSINIDKVGEDTSWTKVCEPGAIDLEQKPKERQVEVGSVILATGAELFDPTSLKEWLGYGDLPDVVTSLEFERIMSASGPTGGEFQRPSDGKKPKRIGWIQCVGSRSTQEPAKPYCSSVCCMFAMKEAVWAKEHFADDLEATIFFMDMRPMGKDYEQYYQRVRNELGVEFVRGRPHTVKKSADSDELLMEYADETGAYQRTRLDMVVLSTGFCAPKDSQAIADTLGIELDRHNFAKAHDFAPVATSKPGIYACGMALGPRDIPDSIVQASAAACMANLALDSPARVKGEDELPPEREVEREEPKVGVFLSETGESGKNPVDLKVVADYFENREDVAHVELVEKLWTTPGLDHMAEAITKNSLNRVVVAAGSPRSLYTMFAETVRKTGLNKAYLDMANILEQDAWVHADDSGVATSKAIDLIRMSVAGVRAATPIHPVRKPIKHSALVLGGGVAGLSASLALADQGVKVHLVEREKQLGGVAMQLERSLDGSPVKPEVQKLIDRVSGHDGITVLTDALVVDHDGQMGGFVTGVQSGVGMYYEEIEHGVTVLATGAKPYQPTEYLYGKNDKVMTQLELEKLLASGEGHAEKLQTVVMIQCVGSRNDENPACGRICCRSAVKNALWIKEVNPEAQVIVLYRDMRMPYVSEESYREAREKNVLFVRYTPDDPPQVIQEDGSMMLRFFDPVLGRPLMVDPSAVVLSVPQIAVDEETEELAAIFRLQRTETGFLMEEHIKLKPVDSAVPGVFLAGSVLAPKSLAEAQTQGLAAAGRALTLLAQQSLTVGAGVAKVDSHRCAACLICVRACPFDVPFINADGYSEIDPAKCQGCGVCAAECPAKAIQLQGYSDDQIMLRTDALLEGVL